MTRIVLLSSPFRKFFLLLSCLLALLFLLAQNAFAQHPGVHTGGGGVHFNTGPHFSPPPMHYSSPYRAPLSPLPSGFSSHLYPSHTLPPHTFAPHSFALSAFHPPASSLQPSTGPRLAPPASDVIVFHPRPIYPFPPFYPIFGAPIFFGYPFWAFGFGFGFNSCWWPNCGPFWGCGYGYNVVPFYQFSLPTYTPPPTYQYPLYAYPESRDLPELFLKDSTVYDVTDYWLVDNQLHFTVVEKGKSVEHVIPFDDLDLQYTINANTRRGFRFVLRNEPLDQYLRDHPDPDDVPPEVTPPQNN